jgi:putative transposase
VQERGMRTPSFKRHRFPAEVIQHAVWLYFRFTLSIRDVEELLAQRGIEVSYPWQQPYADEGPGHP